MKKITKAELEQAMRKFNEEHPEEEDQAKVWGVIVYKQSNWQKKYSVKSRSYKVANCNRAYQNGKIANSVFGYCLDGTDDGVRLDWYKWEPEYCYMME